MNDILKNLKTVEDIKEYIHDLELKIEILSDLSGVSKRELDRVFERYLRRKAEQEALEAEYKIVREATIKFCKIHEDRMKSHDERIKLVSSDSDIVETFIKYLDVDLDAYDDNPTETILRYYYNDICTEGFRKYGKDI